MVECDERETGQKQVANATYILLPSYLCTLCDQADLAAQHTVSYCESLADKRSIVKGVEHRRQTYSTYASRKQGELNNRLSFASQGVRRRA